MTGVTVRGHLVAVEAHVGRGLPSLSLTGLTGAGVQDARVMGCLSIYIHEHWRTTECYSPTLRPDLEAVEELVRQLAWGQGR